MADESWTASVPVVTGQLNAPVERVASGGGGSLLALADADEVTACDRGCVLCIKRTAHAAADCARKSSLPGIPFQAREPK